MTKNKLLKAIFWNFLSLLLFSGLAFGGSETVVIPDTSGSPGDFVTIPVRVDSILPESMVTAAQLKLSFDSNVVRFDTVFFDSTFVPAEWWPMPYSPDAGTFNLALAGDTTRMAGSGTLVYIRFRVPPSASPGDSSLIHFRDMKFNEWVPPVIIDGVFRISPTSVSENENLNLPKGFNLGQNYPNPFNPSTTIPFRVSGSKFMVHSPIRTTLIIYNILGQKMRNLVDETLREGSYQATWDGKNDAGGKVPSGVYFYQLKNGNTSETRKMILIR